MPLRPYLLFLFPPTEVIFYNFLFWHSHFFKFSPSLYLIKFSLYCLLFSSYFAVYFPLPLSHLICFVFLFSYELTFVFYDYPSLYFFFFSRLISSLLCLFCELLKCTPPHSLIFSNFISLVSLLLHILSCSVDVCVSRNRRNLYICSLLVTL